MSGDLGWGWVPISLEGWTITALFIGTLFWLFKIQEDNFIFTFIVILIIFMFIADQKTQDKVLFK